jgi:endonuclease/exonuclease/phosphatase (EEP) superfamily protein YafD
MMVARQTVLLRVAIVATAIGCAGVVATYLVALMPMWPCVLVEHFRVQLVAGGVIVVSCTAALRMRGYFDVAVVAMLLHVLALAPDGCHAGREPPTEGVAVRVLVLNVHTEGSSFDEVARLIEDVQPDIVGLVEVDDRWLTGLAPALARFHWRLEKPRNDNFGVALYTRSPLVASIEGLGIALPSVVGTVDLGVVKLSIILIHPLPPMSAVALTAQGDELDAVANRARGMPDPVVVMGDFNATPWSRPYRRLLARSGLCDSRAGFGVQATFPASSAVLRIPIDHLLASCSVGVSERRVERDVGSDHLPIVVELVLPR